MQRPGPEISRRFVSPAFERPGEIALIRKTEQEGDIRDRESGLAQIFFGELPPHLVHKARERIFTVGQASGQGPFAHGQFARHIPARWLAIRQVIDEAHRLGKPVSVCGEMAGDPAAALALLGLGIDSLSMNASNLPRVKWVIRSMSRSRAREVLGVALKCEDAACVRRLLLDALEDVGLGGLVRPGK